MRYADLERNVIAAARRFVRAVATQGGCPVALKALVDAEAELTRAEIVDDQTEAARRNAPRVAA